MSPLEPLSRLLLTFSMIPDTRGTFALVEYDPEIEGDASICGKPSQLKTEAWKGKKVVVVGVPYVIHCSQPLLVHADSLYLPCSGGARLSLFRVGELP